MARSATGVVRVAAILLLIWLFPRPFEPPLPWPVAMASPLYFKEGSLSAQFRDRI